MRKFRRTPPVPYVPRTPPTGPAGASSACPAEHCGETPPAEMLLATARLTECVLRPGHSGSHADQDGTRWSHLPPAEDTPAVMHVNVLSHPVPMSHQMYEEKAQLGRILREASERYMGAQPVAGSPPPALTVNKMGAVRHFSREEYSELLRLDATDALNGEPAAPDGLREQYERAFLAAHQEWLRPGSDAGDEAIHVVMTDAALAVRDRRMEQLTAGRATWKTKAEEMGADRDRWLAFIDRGMDTHMRFGVINPDGTTEELPCADWCHACRVERAEAAIERVRERCQGVRDRVGASGMINATQILGILSPTWPDGNYEAPAPHEYGPSSPATMPDDTPTTTPVDQPKEH